MENKIIKIQNRFPKIEINETKIKQEYHKTEANTQSLIVKILSVLGGVFAGLVFVAFIGLSGIWESGPILLIFGLIIIFSSLFLHKTVDNLLLDTFSITAFIVGVVMIIMGMHVLKAPINTIISTVFLVGLFSLFINQTYVLAFISFLMIEGSILFFLFENKLENAITFFIIANLIGSVYLFFNEAKFLYFKKKIHDLYQPMRLGFVVSLIIGLGVILLNFTVSITNLSRNFLVVAVALSFLFVVYKIVLKLNIQNSKSRFIILLFSFLFASLSFYIPEIIVALTLLLMSYYVQAKALFVLSILAFITAIGLYYYNLQTTLLNKSIILMVSGVLFLSFYLFILKSRKIEKI